MKKIEQIYPNNQSSFKSKIPSSAPFSSSELKSSIAKPSPSTLPGPGSYHHQIDWIRSKAPTSSFLSNLPRTGPIPIGHSSFSYSPSEDTPGPGAYDHIPKHYSKPQRKFRQLSMIVEATVSSIPYRPGEDQALGPTSYNPDVNLVKPKPLAANFAIYSAKKDMFDSKHNKNVGPGKYSVIPERSFTKPSWVFSSKVDKSQAEKTEQKPGPGAYNPRPYLRQPRVLVEGFGSTTERDILLTNDPHRPYANSDHSQQPSIESSFPPSKIDYYRQKYLNPKTPVPKPAFGSSDKKETVWANMSTIVGPGDYQTSPVSPSLSRFVAKSPRFKSNKPESLPGPGSYEIVAGNRNQGFIGKAARFAEQKNEVPDAYIGHESWRVKQNRAGDAKMYEPNLRFESSSPRFLESVSDSPGPGHYKIAEKKVKANLIHSTESRFSPHGSYIKQSITEAEVGPGSYHNEPKLGKKTFNISPDVGEERPWI